MRVKNSKRRVSVLVCSKNRAHMLRRCLESVLAQDYDDFEIVILDDASEDKEAYPYMIRKLNDTRIHLIRSEKPLGVAGSRNMLMQQAKGDIFFVIDDDAYLEGRGCFSRVAQIFTIKPDVGIIACKVQNHGIVEKPYNVPFKRKVLKTDPTIVEKGRYVGYFLGTAHAVRREVIETCGGYNVSLFFGEEELDLSYRAVSKGWKIWYEPSILVHHVPQPSVLGKGKGEEELFHHVKNRFYLSWRYLPGKYMIPYLGIWLGNYFLEALRRGFWRGYMRGVYAGFCLLKDTPREPLREEALQYLRRNLGRLWY